MVILTGLLLLLAPETERMLLGPSPFFRQEGMERARREQDFELLKMAARSTVWDARRLAAEALGARTPHELLKDPVVVVREAALRALADQAPTELVVPLLRDPDDAVRAAAAWAMVGRRTRKGLAPLLRDSSPTVRVAAMAALGHHSALLSLAKKRDPGVAGPALYALGRAGGTGEAAALVARFRKVLKTLSRSGTPRYLRSEPGPELALARAIGDLARRGLLARDDLLRRLVGKGPVSGSAAVLLAEAIAGARDPDAARVILDLQLRTRRTSTRPNAHFDPAVRGVLHAFSREPWPQLASLLVPLLEDSDPRIRVAVVEALRGISVIPAMNDSHPAVRAAACARVGKLKPLLDRAFDPSPAVRIACARALGRLGNPKAAPALKVLLQQPEAAVRRAAVGALLRIDVEGRAELLYRAATRDESESVRTAAGAVIAFLDEPELLPRAIRELRHERLYVRRNALALLHTLTSARIEYDPERPEPGAGAWLRWWDGRERRVRAPDAFRYHVEDLRRRGLDLVLVVDATGSMAPVIQATKRRLEAVIHRLRAIVPDLRARIVAYRDKGDAFLTLGSPLTHSPRILEDFIASIPAAGGGDAPEAVLDGLRNAMQETPWRNKSLRVVLLFGDAPPHDRDRALLESGLKEFKGVVHAVDCGAALRGTSADFQQIARWGSGAYVRLENEEDLLRSILVLTLGPAHRAAVETLFGL
ncbi:MAG: HEAT repeat domain-containing protein [Planctomycetota bacterium]|jgi:HEAT repeat protein